MKKQWFSLLSAVTALGFTTYIALDTFVIPRSYADVETVTSSSSRSEAASKMEDTEADEQAQEVLAETVVTDTTYSDGNISVVLTTYREYDTTIYVADVTLSSAEYLKTAFANGTYGKNITATTSEMAKENDAILAVNGDYYGVQEEGYVIRGGVLYRSTVKEDAQDLVIYADGSFEVIYEEDISAEELLENGAWDVLSFGPGLVVDGELNVDTDDEVDRAKTSNPRTAIGVIDELHYVFVVADGRNDESEGLSLYQLAQFMQELGCTTAYNLDGGGSSSMVFNGVVINDPSGSSSRRNSSGERSVSDIVYIGY
ncbi:MAG: phosphodiester glycosidase family protein [Lachnospiraceae bacterium]|nr:phosphodiester glycosidase family protein [Lachnospiraceae bacterium]